MVLEPVWPLKEDAKSFAIVVPKVDIVSHLKSRVTQKFPSYLRLQKPSDFKQVWKEGARVSVSPFALVSRRNGLGYPRFGVSISKRNVRLAVQRNRIKRLARHAFRIRQSLLSHR